MGLLDLFSGSGSSGDTTTTTKTAPWGPQQPYLTAGWQQAANIYNTPGQGSYFPGSTVAALPPELQSAWQGTAARATNGAPYQTAAGNQLTGTLNGDYLNPGNPYVQQLTDSISSSVIPQVASMYSSAGRTPGGSALYADTAAKGIAGALAPQLFQNYQAERENQMRGLALSPTVQGLDYTDLGQLGQVGQQEQQYGQNQVNDAFNRYMYNQQLPWQNLSKYMQAVQGNYGTVTQTPVYNNTAASALGGAATGASIGNSIGGGWGAAGGAAIGGLLGLFG